MDFVFTINGVDFVPFIVENGLSWGRNDVDSPEAGQMVNGVMRRDRIIMRRKLEVTTLNKRFTNEQMKTIQQAIYPQWVEVSFPDALEGAILTRNFYSNNIVVNVARFDRATRELYWQGGFKFPLIEEGVPEK